MVEFTMHDSQYHVGMILSEQEQIVPKPEGDDIPVETNET